MPKHPFEVADQPQAERCRRCLARRTTPARPNPSRQSVDGSGTAVVVVKRVIELSGAKSEMAEAVPIGAGETGEDVSRGHRFHR